MNEFINSIIKGLLDGDAEAIQQYTEFLNKVNTRVPELIEPAGNVLYSIICNDSLIGVFASARRKCFQAYVQQGFTEDQAMQLLIADVNLWRQSFAAGIQKSRS